MSGKWPALVRPSLFLSVWNLWINAEVSRRLISPLEARLALVPLRPRHSSSLHAQQSSTSFPRTAWIGYPINPYAYIYAIPRASDSYAASYCAL